jgi:hypothetical protein
MSKQFEPTASSISDTLATWADNFKHNATHAFAGMNPKDWIRIVMIVGTYCLIRPYLIKLGARAQQKQHEKDAAATLAEISPNELRGEGKIQIPGLGDSDEEEDTEVKPGDWGKKARVRQRKFIRDAIKKEEDRLRDEQEAESDKEIEQFLVD